MLNNMYVGMMVNIIGQPHMRGYVLDILWPNLVIVQMNYQPEPLTIGISRLEEHS